jgi:hypothetical protein
MEASIADARRPMIAAPTTGREILVPLPALLAVLQIVSILRGGEGGRA